MRIAAMAAGGLMLSACTTSLSVSELAPPDASATARQKTLPAGLVYHLPAAVVTPAAFVAIRDCPVDADLAKQLKDIRPTGVKPVTEITFVVGGALGVTQVPDQAIVIDYRNLQKFLKTTSLSLERWPNGMLKSVNASVEDQTPEAIAALAAAAGSVALLATGAPGAGALAMAPGVVGGRPAPGGPSPAAAGRSERVGFLACNARTMDLVSRRKAAAKVRDDAVSLLDTASAAASRLGGQANADQAALDKLKADVAKHSARLETATGELAGIDAQITLPLNMIAAAGGGTPTAIPDTGQIAPTLLLGGAVMTPSALDAFVSAHFVDGSALLPSRKRKSYDQRACAWSDVTRSAVPDETCTGLKALRPVLAKVARIEINDKTLRAVAAGAGDQRPASTALISVRKAKDGVPGAEIAANQGIIYVEPRKLRIEMTTAAIGPTSLVSPVRVVKSADVSIPQLGRYLSLPVRAGFGEKVQLQATFAEDGSLLTATYANPKTGGLAVANMLRDLAGTAVTTRNGIEDRRLKLAKTRSETLAALVDAQESAGKLTPTTDPLADINAQLARANAEASLAEAEVRIQAARARLLTP